MQGKGENHRLFIKDRLKGENTDYELIDLRKGEGQANT